MRNKRSQSGIAVVEFTLSTMFLIPLLLGTFVFGFRLIRSIEMAQIVRDLGHMYVRGVNFRNAGPQQNATTLASGFNLTVTGTSDVLLSQIRLVQQSDCDAVDPVGTHCTNLNKPVFIEQLTMGNASSGSSRFGTPPTSNGYVSPTDFANNAAAQVTNFSPSVMTLTAGVIAYVAEMNNQTPDLNVPGFSGAPLVYARAIF